MQHFLISIAEVYRKLHCILNISNNRAKNIRTEKGKKYFFSNSFLVAIFFYEKVVCSLGEFIFRFNANNPDGCRFKIKSYVHFDMITSSSIYSIKVSK